MRRWRLYFILGGIVLLGLIYALAPRPEPWQEGRPLSEWMAMYGGMGYHYTNGTVEKEAARNALAHIGPAALPHLMKYTRATPAWQWHFLQTVDGALKAVGSDWSFINQTGNRLNNAMRSLKALTPQAEESCAELVRLSKKTQDSQQWFCVVGLTEFGDKAIPALMTVVTNPEITAMGPRISARDLAIYHLGELGTNARAAIPVLRQALNDPKPDIRAHATNALRQIAPEEFKDTP